MLVSDAKTMGIIPKKFWGIFRDDCPYCEDPLDITTNRKTLTCTNEFCPNKTDKRLSFMLKKFGIKGIGDSTAEDLMDSIEMYRKHRKDVGEKHEILDKYPSVYVSPMEIFFLPLSRYPYKNSYTVNLKRYNDIQEVAKKNFTFAEVVMHMALPKLGKTALKVFSDYESFEDMARKTNKLQELYYHIIKKLGQSETARHTFLCVRTYMADFYLADKIFNYRKGAKEVWEVVTTGSITKVKGYTVPEFMNYLNKLGGEKLNVVNGKARQSAKYIIADSKNPTESYVVGIERNKRENREVMVTSDKFLEIFKKRLGELGEG